MRADLLVAEIGSTTTLVTAFGGLAGGEPRRLGQGQAATTVLDGDVTVGLMGAVARLRAALAEPLEWDKMVASSSAAGGLRMTVHGLVYDMTVRAAREAALGAGANLKLITAGEMTEDDIEDIRDVAPNIILLAGGVDYGEKDTVLRNARLLAESGLKYPVIYAGNAQAKTRVARILEKAGVRVFPVENVYPKIDTLNVEPTRAVIQDVFERHITEAPGMAKIREMVTGRIIPTPGAVMLGAKLLRGRIGDLAVLDVGGATTDVHSVTDGAAENARLAIAPEPTAKRTVEGDLGVFVSAGQVADLAGRAQLAAEIGCGEGELMGYCRPIPQTEREFALSGRLAAVAATTAMDRHVGGLTQLYGPSGRVTIMQGKDLTAVKWIIGTGGALTKLPQGRNILQSLNHRENTPRLFPKNGRVLQDSDYIMAAAGLMSDIYPQAALRLMQKSLGLTDDEFTDNGQDA